jgi:hypothetical protein
VQKPYKGGLARNRVFMRGPDEVKRRPIETLGRRRMWRLRQICEARERRSGEIPVKACVKNPRRAKPKGASSRRRAKHTSGCQGLSEGSKPRNRGLSSRPVGSPAGATAGETVRGCIRRGNAPGTFREGNAPKGES